MSWKMCVLLGGTMAMLGGRLAMADMKALPIPGEHGAWLAMDATTGKPPTVNCVMWISSGPKYFFVTLIPGHIRVILQDHSAAPVAIGTPEEFQLDFQGMQTFTTHAHQNGTAILADYDNASVSFIHNLTAGKSLIVTANSVFGDPWTIDLHGSTAAELAMAHCGEAEKIPGLPAPFLQFPFPESQVSSSAPLASAETQNVPPTAVPRDLLSKPSSQTPSMPPTPSAVMCKSMTNPDDRLKCYDAFMGTPSASPQNSPSPSPVIVGQPQASPNSNNASGTNQSEDAGGQSAEQSTSPSNSSSDGQNPVPQDNNSGNIDPNQAAQNFDAQYGDWKVHKDEFGCSINDQFDLKDTNGQDIANDLVSLSVVRIGQDSSVIRFGTTDPTIASVQLTGLKMDDTVVDAQFGPDTTMNNYNLWDIIPGAGVLLFNSLAKSSSLYLMFSNPAVSVGFSLNGFDTAMRSYLQVCANWHFQSPLSAP